VNECCKKEKKDKNNIKFLIFHLSLSVCLKKLTLKTEVRKCKMKRLPCHHLFKIEIAMVQGQLRQKISEPLSQTTTQAS
jgi:hypothetical protein